MSKKIADHIERNKPISFQFDKVAVAAFEGETIAAALLRAGITNIRNVPNSAAPRGMFCAMGICQECVVSIDDKRVEACRTSVQAGQSVQRVDNV